MGDLKVLRLNKTNTENPYDCKGFASWMGITYGGYYANEKTGTYNIYSYEEFKKLIETFNKTASTTERKVIFKKSIISISKLTLTNQSNITFESENKDIAWTKGPFLEFSGCSNIVIRNMIFKDLDGDQGSDLIVFNGLNNKDCPSRENCKCVGMQVGISHHCLITNCEFYYPWKEVTSNSEENPWDEIIRMQSPHFFSTVQKCYFHKVFQGLEFKQDCDPNVNKYQMGDDKKDYLHGSVSWIENIFYQCWTRCIDNNAGLLHLLNNVWIGNDTKISYMSRSSYYGMTINEGSLIVDVNNFILANYGPPEKGLNKYKLNPRYVFPKCDKTALLNGSVTSIPLTMINCKWTDNDSNRVLRESWTNSFSGFPISGVPYAYQITNSSSKAVFEARVKNCGVIGRGGIAEMINDPSRTYKDVLNKIPNA